MGQASSITSPTLLRSESGAVRRTVADKLNETLSVKDFGAGSGGSNDATAINAAATAAKSSGKTLYFPDGTYATTATCIFDCDVASAGGATISYTGTGTAVQLGTTADSAALQGKHLVLPRIVKSSLSYTSNTTGIKVVAAIGAYIRVRWIDGFFDGLSVYADAVGIYDNRFDVQTIIAKRCILLDNANAGFTDDNTFDGGQYSIPGSGTTPVSGTRIIQVGTATSATPPDNNRFIHCDLEGDRQEYHLECYGTDNLFNHCRWEVLTGTPRVKWSEVDASNYATHNWIRGGLASDQITATSSTHSKNNRIDSGVGTIWGGGTATVPLFALSNGAGSTSPIIVGLAAIGDNPTTEYLTELSAAYSKYKAKGDTYPQIWIDHGLGAIYIGNGAGSPTGTYLRNNTGGRFEVVGMNFGVSTAGKGLFVAEGSNAKQGTATLSSGTATVSTTSVTASSRIFLTGQDNNVTGSLRVSAKSAGTSFVITSSNAGDSGLVAYEIFEPG